MKRNDLGRFAICNIETVDKIMNTPIVSKERAMARLLCHKSIKQRFLDLKLKHSDIPTARLLEQDPKKVNRKKRKEHLKKKMNDPKAQENKKQSENDLSKSLDDDDESERSDTEDVEQIGSILKLHKKEKIPKKIISTSNFKVERVKIDDDKSYSPLLECMKDELNKKRKHSVSDESSLEEAIHENESSQSEDISDDESSKYDDINEDVSSQEDDCESKEFESPKLKPIKSVKQDLDSIKDSTLHKEKLFKKKKEFVPVKNLIDSNELPSDFPVEKRVDSFFMTDVGSNYMTMAIPRPADKLVQDDDEKSYGMTKNRKMRRAALFGNDVILTNKFNKKKRYDDSDRFDRSTNEDNGRFDRSKNEDNERFTNQKSRNGSSDNLHTNYKTHNRMDFKDDVNKTPLPESKVEKLHPSWQAKKQQSTILPFQGNKIVFD